VSGIAASLDWLADRNIDPVDEIYAHTFSVHPGMARLFTRDSDGSIKANMIYRAFEAVLDMDGANSYGANFIGCEVVNHQNLGVDADVFVSFYDIMRDVVREKIGAAWTPAMENAWQDVIARINGVAVERLAPSGTSAAL